MNAESLAPTTDERIAQLERDTLRRRQLQRMGGLFAAIAAFGWSLWIFAIDLHMSTAVRSVIALSTLIMLVLAIGTLHYLQPTDAKRRKPASRDYVDQQVIAMARQLNGARATSVNAGALDEAVAQLKDDLCRGVGEELLADVRAAARAEEPVREIAVKTARMETRRGQEIVDLARRGNVNLVLGMITTLAGLLVLGYAVITASVAATATDLVLHFLPRFAFAALIEVFAYFFLRLYKQGLAEIKYFQNELTNAESRAIAIQMALHTSEPGLLAELSRTLAATERNFILMAGQSTVELERERITQKEHAKLLEILEHFSVGTKAK